MSNGKYSNEASYPQTRIQSDSSHTDAPAPITALNQTSLVDETPDSNLMGLVTEQMQEDMVHKSSEHPNPPHLPPLALIQATNAEEPSTQPISSSRPSLTNVDAITPIPGVSNVSLPGRYVQFAPQQSISTPSLLKTQAFREDKEAPTITKPKGVAGSISSTSQLTRINSSSTTLPTRKSAGPRPFAGHSNAPLPQAAHALPATALATHLTTNLDDGLSRTTATQRLAQYGANELGDGARVRVWQVVGRQVANAMTLVLTLAMAVSFGIGSYIEGGVVALVIALNVVVGSWQEYAAEKTMGGLRQLASPTANVVREGVNWTVPTREVVVGDMVELTVGDTVPADIRLVEAVNFETDESLLTGESLPVRKDAELVLDEDTGPGDRLNVAFSTSTVTKGRARGIVFATGMFTGIGSIAQSLRDSNSKVRQVRRKADGTVKPHWYVKAWAGTGWDALRRFLGVSVGTPLQQKLSVLALLLFGVAIVCAIIVLGANGWANNREVIIYAVATGLSMIPASLVVVLIITMANGTHAMSKRNVIVRNAKSLESLGSVTDICSDKTGTITQGKMVVARAWIPSPMGGTFIVEKSEDPFNPRKGAIIRSSQRPIEVGEEKCEAIDPLTYVNDQTVQLREFLNTASLANLANVHRGKSEDEWMARGDPTEIAIQVFASRFDWNRARWTGGEKLCWKQVTEFPFDSNVKRMSVIFEHLESHERWVFTKGAVERIIDRCVWIHEESEDKACNMTEHHRQDILEQMNALASMGLRTLAFASRRLMDEAKEYREEDRDEIETDLVFRGIVGIYDPPRPESAGSVKMCHEAGIVVHMLTGDHPGTAQAIAKEVGILPTDMSKFSKNTTDAMVMTASQFDSLTDEEIDRLPALPLVIARCAPDTKVRMIEALHRRKKFAAMTGDGVNDAPSLNRADVGIAMGQGGSDVAKDASDIVLSDDNFASILNAVEEGRRMFNNIQKFILHLLAQNVAQALVLLIGLAFKDHTGFSVFPISPVEIMWVIMITSSIPDMGLGFEAASPDIMRDPPKNLKTGVFTWEVMIDVVVYGLWIALLCLAGFSMVLFRIGNGDLGDGCNNAWSPSCDEVFRARATAFACLTWFSVFLAWELVDPRQSLFCLGRGSGRWFGQVLFANKVLFFSVMLGLLTLPLVLYIPVINTKVFKHAGITWEWAVVVIASGLFFLGVEVWKWAKRVYFRRKYTADMEGKESKEDQVLRLLGYQQ